MLIPARTHALGGFYHSLMAALERKKPIFMEHSLQSSVGLCLSVCLPSALWQTADVDAVWDGMSYGLRDEAAS